MKIGIHGATGKIGKLLKTAVLGNDQLALAYEYAPSLVDANLVELCKLSDIIIDFSSPIGTELLLDMSADYPVKLVIGTTGLTCEQEQKIKTASINKPILYAANMSFFVYLLNKAIKSISGSLNDCDINIIDIHHKYKKDAPSGTALMLKNNFDKSVECSSIRAGNIAGEHQILLTKGDEQLIFTHRVASKQPFIEGAIKAALWLTEQLPGLYSIENVYKKN